MEKSLTHKFIFGILSWPLYLFSYLIPRSNKIWILGGWFGHRFSDNSRYIIEYLWQNEPGIRPIWVTHRFEIVKEIHELGNEAYLINSFWGYWYCCRAGVTIISSGNADVNRYAISNSTIVQLWHGTPVKKIKLDDMISENPTNTLRQYIKQLFKFLFPIYRERWDIAISSCRIASRKYASAFGMNVEQILLTGSPRADIILSPNPTPVKIIEDIKKNGGIKKVILYAPTFRKNEKDIDFLFESLNTKQLNKLLEEFNAILFIKMHFGSRSIHSKIKIQEDISNIKWVTEDELSDINLLLPFVDILITDYSGIYYDFLLLSRPIIFSPFDIDNYVKKERELYEDYYSISPGPKCKNWDEILIVLRNFLEGKDDFIEVRIKAMHKYNGYIDNKNSQRVVTEIIRVLKLDSRPMARDGLNPNTANCKEF